MAKVFTLVKVFLFEAFNFNKYKEKSKNGKNKGLGIAILMAVLLIVYGYVFVNMFLPILSMGTNDGITTDNLLLIPIFMISMIAIMFIFLSGNMLSFSDKDMSVLGPLPIDEKKIVSAKLIVAYIFESVFQIYIGACALIAYFIVGNISFIGILSMLAAMFLSPIVPMVLLSFLILVIRRGIQKSKHRRALEMVMGFISITLVMAFSFSISFISSFIGAGEGAEGLTNLSALMNPINSIAQYFPFVFFLKMGFDTGSILYPIFYIISNVLLAYVFVLAFNKFAYKLMLNYKYTREEKVKGPIEYKKKNVQMYLLKKEFKRMGSSNIYLSNIIMMPVLLVIFSAATIFIDDIKAITSLAPGAGGYIAAALVLFSTLFIFTPAFTMSLEGKYLWIIKSLPIKTDEIFKAKIIFNMILQIVPSILIIIFSSIAFKLSWVWIVCLLFFSIASAFGSSVYYLRVNLKHPKLDATDMIIIKQSTSVMIVSLTSFLILGAEVLIYYVLTLGVTDEAALLMMGALNALIGVIYAYVLKKKGAKLFEAFY